MMKKQQPIQQSFADTTKIYRRHLIPFLLIATVFNLPVSALSMSVLWMEDQVLPSFVTLGVIILYLNAALIMAAAIAHATSQHIEGSSMSAKEIYAQAWRCAPSILWIGLLQGLLICLGFIACLIPGLVAAVLTFVAAPSAIIETSSPFQALRRSLALTSGSRGSILIAVIVIGMPPLFAMTCVESLKILLLMAKRDNPQMLMWIHLTVHIISSLFCILWTGWGATLCAITYHHLKERTASSVQAVFS